MDEPTPETRRWCPCRRLVFAHRRKDKKRLEETLLSLFHRLSPVAGASSTPFHLDGRLPPRGLLIPLLLIRTVSYWLRGFRFPFHFFAFAAILDHRAGRSSAKKFPP